MFDQSQLRDALSQYKEAFAGRWEAERYKWEAVKHFQDNWDARAADFAGMLERSLAKTSNLLVSRNNFPAKMIVEFAEAAPEEVRAMFTALFDESADYYGRIEAFKTAAVAAHKKYRSDAKNHYQNENAITTYLWLRYPEKYFRFQFEITKLLAERLGSNIAFHKGAYAENLRNHHALYSELSEELGKDTQLVALLRSKLTEDCHQDPRLHTLAIDFGYFISQSQADQAKPSQSDDWFPSKSDYDPGITADKWLELLQDRKVFDEGKLKIVRSMKAFGGEATCKQLAMKYGETPGFYNAGSIALAKRVAQQTGCPVLENNNKDAKWWPILYQGRHARNDEPGIYVWRLRDELSEALTRLEKNKPLVAQQDKASAEAQPPRGYWWLNANPKIWSFANMSVGETQTYTLFNENGNKRRVFQNFLDAKAGDMVIGYESAPVKQLVALAQISKEQDGKQIVFKKLEALESPIAYEALHECPELRHMEFFSNPRGSLFKLTSDEYNFILDLIREENPLAESKPADSYSRKEFLEEVFMDGVQYDRLASLLRNKKNVILQGAPGVGKTFTARRLAWSMMGMKDDSRIEFVQFHQNYTYEDFIMGYKPQGASFELQYGVFYRFCQKAANNPGKDYFFIIDEINRGNLSKIFGELLMLVERDWRGHRITLSYDGKPFSVPKNLYIIGMMNTADRSLALIDYALRRRFSFFDMSPGFDSKGFVEYAKSLQSRTFNTLIEKVKELNDEIARDKSLGKGFCIGHSYFAGQEVCTDEWLRSVVDFDILPMLSEYWFDDEDKVRNWDSILHGVFQS